MNYPKVSIVIPTYNSKDFIWPCLESIFKQNYPKNKIEAIVVDSIETTDNTEEIAKKYPVVFLKNPKKLAEPAKTLGFKHATGELFLYLDSDAELVSKNWLKRVIHPLMVDQTIVGSTTRYMVNKKQSSFNRYVSQNPLQLWSMLAFLLPSFSDVTVEKKKEYDVFIVNPVKCPPVGMCVYRMNLLKKIIKNPDTFNYVDIAIPIQLAEIGYDRFAYVDNAGFYHRRSDLLRELRRQKRDVAVTYLPVVGQRKFHYVDFKNPMDLVKIIFWVIYVNLLFPSFFVGIYKAIKYKDLAGLYELPTNFLLTNYIIYLFLTEKNGQALIKNIFKGKGVSSIKTQKLKKIYFVDKKKN